MTSTGWVAVSAIHNVLVCQVRNCDCCDCVVHIVNLKCMHAKCRLSFNESLLFTHVQQQHAYGCSRQLQAAAHHPT